MPVIILAAWIWIFSISLNKYSCLGALSQTTQPYSNSGLIKAKYIFSKADLPSLYFNARIISTRLTALFIAFNRWFFHDPLSFHISPKWLCTLTFCTVWFWNRNIESVLSNPLDIRRASDLRGLNFIFHLSAQCSIVNKSCCISLLDTIGSVICFDIDVSSA